MDFALLFEFLCFRKCVSAGANSLWRDVRCDNWAGKVGNTWSPRLPLPNSLPLAGNQWQLQKNQNRSHIPDETNLFSYNGVESQGNYNTPSLKSKIQNAPEPWQHDNDSTHVSIMNEMQETEMVMFVCQMPTQNRHQLREKQELVLLDSVARQLYLLAAIAVTILCLVIMLCILIVLAISWNNGLFCFHKDSLVPQGPNQNMKIRA